MRYDCYYEFHSTFSHITVDFFSFAGNFFFALQHGKKLCKLCGIFKFFYVFLQHELVGIFFFCCSNWISCAELCTQFWFGLSLMCNKMECTTKFLTGQSRWHEVKRDIHFGTIRKAILRVKLVLVLT